MIELLKILAVDFRTSYNVEIDIQYIYLIAYLAPLIVCTMLRLFVPKLLRWVLGIIFAVTFMAYWFIVLVDQPLNRIIVVIIIAVGTASGLSSAIRYLLKKIKNIGDDNSYFS